jgi:hypothetical protein
MFDSLTTTESGDLRQCISEAHATNCGPERLFRDHNDIYVDRNARFNYTADQIWRGGTIPKRRDTKTNQEPNIDYARY